MQYLSRAFSYNIRACFSVLVVSFRFLPSSSVAPYRYGNIRTEHNFSADVQILIYR